MTELKPFKKAHSRVLQSVFGSAHLKVSNRFHKWAENLGRTAASLRPAPAIMMAAAKPLGLRSDHEDVVKSHHRRYSGSGESPPRRAIKIPLTNTSRITARTSHRGLGKLTWRLRCIGTS